VGTGLWARLSAQQQHGRSSGRRQRGQRTFSQISACNSRSTGSIASGKKLASALIFANRTRYNPK
jgi:hypothetical protein